MTCPKCHSEEWKLASFVYKSGLVNVNETTATLGAIDGDLGVALGRTTGTHQSALSEMAAPPVKPEYNVPFRYWLLVGGVSLIGFDSNRTFSVLVLAVGTYYWLKNKDGFKERYLAVLREYETRLAQWEQTRVCQRCACFYLPDGMVVTNTSHAESDAN